MALYDEVMVVAKPYLGIATDQFLKRQLKHINVEPAALQKGQVGDLAKWIEVSSKMLMGEAKAKELKEKVLKLS
ncbi:MAG: hypothetical protein HYU64_11190 [Armatimonadetes bacterium]|nr:hypothetical protein [Armatimonadota bacterium]